jgi:hypothetical protein
MDGLLKLWSHSSFPGSVPHLAYSPNLIMEATGSSGSLIMIVITRSLCALNFFFFFFLFAYFVGFGIHFLKS